MGGVSVCVYVIIFLLVGFALPIFSAWIGRFYFLADVSSKYFQFFLTNKTLKSGGRKNQIISLIITH